MLTKLRTLVSLYQELGFRWSAFRVAYAFRIHTGLIRSQMPMGEWSDYKNHISNKPADRVAEGVSRPRHLPESLPWNPQTAIDEADRILNGELKYFAHKWVKTDFPPNWHKDYFANHVTLSASERSLSEQSETLRSQRRLPQSDKKKHWSQISDDANSDIKFVWEPNRFAFIYTLVRAYAASQDEKYAEAFWQLILDWAKHNPPNTGANWKDGQEIALRLMAWTFGYHAFIDSPSSTSERKSQFVLFVAVQAERIYKNIGYAISTRSNHTISEAFGLWLVGLLFPELKYSEKYSSLGRKLLEQEAATQIFPDGTYSMYSLNYHRFILHIYLYAIQLGKINDAPFSAQLVDAVTKSIEYLSQLVDWQTGQMPVYGSNDGALVLPLNNCDFTDYRPLLQLGWYITKGATFFEPGASDEDIFWLTGEIAVRVAAERRIEREGEGGTSFPHGGTYLLRGPNSHVIIRCTDYMSRPSHADQLHVDLWMHGHNIAGDAGTYLYSGEGIWRNGLARTSVHNTVTVDNNDQMTMVSRFTWTNWSKGKVIKHNKDIWQGGHDGYEPVHHRRTVMVLDGDRWLVVDDLEATKPHHYALHWLLNDVPFTEKKNSIHLNYESHTFKIETGLMDGEGKFTILRADPNSTYGWRSRYYGHKEPAISLLLETLSSNARFWTFFGFEKDTIQFSNRGVQINGVEVDLY